MQTWQANRKVNIRDQHVNISVALSVPGTLEQLSVKKTVRSAVYITNLWLCSKQHKCLQKENVFRVFIAIKIPKNLKFEAAREHVYQTLLNQFLPDIYKAIVDTDGALKS